MLCQYSANDEENLINITFVNDNVTHYAVPLDHQKGKKGHKTRFQAVSIVVLPYLGIPEWCRECRQELPPLPPRRRLHPCSHIWCCTWPQLIILGSRESHSLDCVVEEHGILWHDSHRLPQTWLAEAFHVLASKHHLSPFHIKHSQQQLCHRGLSTPRAEMFCWFVIFLNSNNTFQQEPSLCQVQSWTTHS